MGRVKVLLTPEHPALVGCVTVSFHEEKGARTCLEKLNNRWFDGRQITVQLLLPVASQRGNGEDKPLEADTIPDTSLVPLETENQEAIEEAVQGVDDFLNSLL